MNLPADLSNFANQPLAGLLIVPVRLSIALLRVILVLYCLINEAIRARQRRRCQPTSLKLSFKRFFAAVSERLVGKGRPPSRRTQSL